MGRYKKHWIFAVYCKWKTELRWSLTYLKENFVEEVSICEFMLKITEIIRLKSV